MSDPAEFSVRIYCNNISSAVQLTLIPKDLLIVSLNLGLVTTWLAILLVHQFLSYIKFIIKNIVLCKKLLKMISNVLSFFLSFFITQFIIKGLLPFIRIFKYRRVFPSYVFYDFQKTGLGNSLTSKSIILLRLLKNN